MRNLILTLVVLLPMTTMADDLANLQILHGVQYEKVTAEQIGRDFHIYTMLPASYDTEPDRAYATIYLLDGGNLFPMLGSYYRYLSIIDELDDIIIVGIAYGSDSEDGNFRSTDYTAPSDERDFWGGAAKFQAFLKTTLLPHVETNYRSDPARRVLMGHSLGGQFVLFSAQTEPDLFWGRLASNPALHRNLEFFLNTVPNPTPTTNLFVGSGTKDSPRFREPALSWIGHWTGQDSVPWNLNVQHLEGHTHMSTPPVVFRQGLLWLNAVDSGN